MNVIVKAAMFSKLSKAVYALKRCEFRYGKYVFVSGCDALSLLIGSVAKSSGAAAVVLCAQTQEQAERIKKLGFYAYGYGEDIEDIVSGVTKGRKFDLAFETLGDAKGVEAILAAVKPGAYVGLLSKLPEPYTFLITTAIRNQIHFIGIKNSDDTCRGIAEELIAGKRMDFSVFINGGYGETEAVLA